MANRKTRTRTHVIASMSMHHVGYITSKVGYTFDVPSEDYGFDGIINTCEDSGEIESEYILVQLKATDNLRSLEDGKIAFSLDMRDINFWNDNFFPVILVVFDTREEKGYFIIIQDYFKTNPLTPEQIMQSSLTVHIDPAAIVDESAVRSWRDVKNAYRKART